MIKTGRNPTIVIYALVQDVSEITTWGNNGTVSGGRKRPRSGGPGGHLFPLKRDLGGLSDV